MDVVWNGRDGGTLANVFVIEFVGWSDFVLLMGREEERSWRALLHRFFGLFFLIANPMFPPVSRSRSASKQAVRHTHAHNHLNGVESSPLRANGNGCGVGFLSLAYARIFSWINKRRRRRRRGERGVVSEA